MGADFFPMLLCDYQEYAVPSRGRLFANSRELGEDATKNVLEHMRTPVLLVDAIITHSGKLINRRVYPGTQMEASVGTLLESFGKPITDTHPQRGLLASGPDPKVLGRIAEAAYTKTVTDAHWVNDWKRPTTRGDSKGSGFIRVKARITDREAIQEIVDGRMLTLSQGHNPKKFFCSICQTDWIASGPCDHEFGKNYKLDTKTKKGEFQAFGITGFMRYHHVAKAPFPADEEAKIEKFSFQDAMHQSDGLWHVPPTRHRGVLERITFVDEASGHTAELFFDHALNDDASDSDLRQEGVQIVAVADLSSALGSEEGSVNKGKVTDNDNSEEENSGGENEPTTKPEEDPKPEADPKPESEAKPEGEAAPAEGEGEEEGKGEGEGTSEPAVEAVEPESDEGDAAWANEGPVEFMGAIEFEDHEQMVEMWQQQMEAEEIPSTDRVLTTSARKKLKGSQFCGPNRTFLVPDAAHARNALARLEQGFPKDASEATKSKIKACVMSKAEQFGVKIKSDSATQEADIPKTVLNTLSSQIDALKSKNDRLETVLATRDKELAAKSKELTEQIAKNREQQADRIIDMMIWLNKPETREATDEEKLQAVRTEVLKRSDDSLRDRAHDLQLELAEGRGSGVLPGPGLERPSSPVVSLGAAPTGKSGNGSGNGGTAKERALGPLRRQ